MWSKYSKQVVLRGIHAEDDLRGSILFFCIHDQRQMSMVGLLSQFGVRRSQWRPLLAGLLFEKVVLSIADGGKLCVLLNVLGYEVGL